MICGAGIMADQQQLVEQLFDAALAIKPADRHAFLEKVCGADLDLRRSIEYLLVKDPRARSSPQHPPPGFLDKTTIDIRDSPPSTGRDADQAKTPIDHQCRPSPGDILGC